MTSETCQICGKTRNPSAPGHCSGHDNPTSSKQRLDAIRGAGAGGRSPVLTDQAPGLSLKEQLDAIPAPSGSSAPAAPSAPPVGAAGNKKGPGSILGRKTGAGTEDISALKNQLDAIPSPGAGVSDGSVSKDLLDSIPTPGSGGRPAANISPSALDSIPTPGSGGRPAASVSSSALDSIPTPGGGGAAPVSGASLLDQLNSIPTPSSTGSHPMPDKPAGEVPEWMKNFEKHQSAISTSIAGQGGQPSGGFGGGGGYSSPDAVPASYNSSRGGGEAPPQGSAYTMVIGIVILICIVMFGYLMISKPAPSVMPSDPSMTTPASSMPSTSPMPAIPGIPGTTQATPAVPSMPVNNVPVPGAPQGMPVQPMTQPVPGAVPQAVPAQPVPGAPQGMPVTPDPNATMPVQQGNNPVMPTGNNP